MKKRKGQFSIIHILNLQMHLLQSISKGESHGYTHVGLLLGLSTGGTAEHTWWEFIASKLNLIQASGFTAHWLPPADRGEHEDKLPQ